MARSLGKLLAALRCCAVASILVAALPAPEAAAGPVAPENAASPTLVIVADTPVSRQAVAGLGAKLPGSWRLGNDARLRKALAAAGQKTAAGVALGNASGRAALADKAQAAARDAGAQAVLFVRVAPKGSSHAVTLFLVAPGVADPLVDTTVDAPAGDEGDALLPTLQPALARVASPPSSTAPSAGTSASSAGTSAPPADAAAPPADAAAVAPPPQARSSSLGGADRALFVLAAGGGSGARIFRYYDGISPELRSYDLAASPVLVLAAELYPLARLGIPVVSGLGIYGGFQHALGVTSETSSGASVSTTWWRAEGGLRLRLAFGEQGRFILGLSGGLVKERFGFDGDPKLVPWLPDVDYLFWRAGVDGRVRLGPVGLLAQAAYLPAIESGALADRFRQTSFAGVELGGGLAVPVASIFEMRATAVYTRVFYAFDPRPGDVYVAGGALDHFVRAQILATLQL